MHLVTPESKKAISKAEKKRRSTTGVLEGFLEVSKGRVTLTMISMF
jgi:hypothetical protein